MVFNMSSQAYIIRHVHKLDTVPIFTYSLKTLNNFYIHLFPFSLLEKQYSCWFLSHEIYCLTLTELLFPQTPEELDDSDFETEDFDVRSRTSIQTEDDQLIAGQSARVRRKSEYYKIVAHLEETVQLALKSRLNFWGWQLDQKTGILCFQFASAKEVKWNVACVGLMDVRNVCGLFWMFWKIRVLLIPVNYFILWHCRCCRQVRSWTIYLGRWGPGSRGGVNHSIVLTLFSTGKCQVCGQEIDNSAVQAFFTKCPLMHVLLVSSHWAFNQDNVERSSKIKSFKLTESPVPVKNEHIDRQ